MLVDRETVAFTKSEYMICEFLARNKGQVFTREQIYEAVFSLDGLLGGLLGAVAIPFLLLTFSTTLGLTTYGDYSEIKANELAPIIAATPDLSDVQIPMEIEYVLLDKNYQLLETTLDENELEQAMQYATTGASDQNLQKRYLFVTRENEYVVLQYYIGAQFTNEWINEHLPSPDVLLIVLIAVNSIFVCLFLTTRFAKKLRLQLVPLFDATSEVAKQNLDFEVGHSKIKEFEDVLISFSHMKESLKTSLEQQDFAFLRHVLQYRAFARFVTDIPAELKPSAILSSF